MAEKKLDKIELITNRIEELKGLIAMAILKNSPELRLLKHSLMINQKILYLLQLGHDISFYKISESYNTLDPSGFFLSPTEITNPFLSVMN